MNTSLRWIVRIAVGTALAGFVIAGGLSIFDVLTRTHVLEFQAGEPSSAMERAIAVAHCGAIEGIGFGAIGAVLSLFAIGLARLRTRTRPERFRPELAASVALTAAAFIGWLEYTWIAEDALPFLQPLSLVWLNLGALAAALVAFYVFDLIVRRLPGAPRDALAAIAVGSSASALFATHEALSVLRAVSGGFRSPWRLGAAAFCFVVAAVVAVFVARLLAPLFAKIGQRLENGPLFPRPLTIGAGVLLIACVALTVPFFHMSAVQGDVEYAKLDHPQPTDGPNVVFITIDTLRADHLGCYGYERPTSPTLDSIANEGTLFLDPSAAAAWTKPATGTILTGLYPSRHGALYHGSILQLPEGKKTLAERFREAGYVTAGFVSNPNIKRVFKFDRGFDEFFDSPVEDTITLASIRGTYFGRILMKLARHQFNWKYENDVHQMNRHIFSWLDVNHDRPFFAYLHYIDPHIPYTPPSPYLEQFTRDHGMVLFNERKELVGKDLYDGEIRYMDEGIADLVAKLKEHGIWDDTIVVVTSDHGEEFFEHGVLGHGFSLYQPVIQVPVFMRGPGIAAGRRVADPVQVLDLPATVLDLAGTGVTQLGDGTSFANAARLDSWDIAQPLYLENEFGQTDADNRSFVLNGIRKGPWKLVLTERNAYFPPQRYGGEALYNLDDDPGEQVNLLTAENADQYGPIVHELLGALKEHAAFLSDTGFRDVAPAAMDPAVEDQMRKLGYLGGDTH